MKQSNEKTFVMPITDVCGKSVGKVAIFNDVAIKNLDYLRSIYQKCNTRELGRVCKNEGVILNKHSNNNLTLEFNNVKVFYSYGRFTAFSINGTRFISSKYGTYSNTTTRQLNKMMCLGVSRCYSNRKFYLETNNRYNWFNQDDVPMIFHGLNNSSFTGKTEVSIEQDTRGVI